MKLFSKNIRSKIETAKQNIQNKFDSERVQMVEISKLKFDKDFKGLFKQEPEKVARIAENLRQNGFDKSQPLIVTKDYRILDGNSRYLACREVGIQYVPVVVKDFADKDEALKYELHLQLDRRNLNDSQIFLMFKKLEEMKNKAKIEGKTTEEFTDAKIAEQLNKSERQVQKLRELSKKADEGTIQKVSAGKMTINQAYSEVKKAELPPVQKLPKSVNESEFKKGVAFAMKELAKGKTPQEILLMVQEA